jgi:hypothetical protein
MGIVLGCRCGEELFLMGREEYWRKEGRTCFECGVGGEELSLDDVSRRRDKANLGVSEVPLGPLIRCIA